MVTLLRDLVDGGWYRQNAWGPLLYLGQLRPVAKIFLTDWLARAGTEQYTRYKLHPQH